MSQEKEWVKQNYGVIAAGKQSGCCGPSPCGCGDPAALVAQAIGYDAADLSAVPQGANLGLGCGNPLALASIKPGETVLDLGSGAGFDAFLAAAKVGPAGKVIGVDLTPEMIEKARANAARDGVTNVDFRLGDIESMPVEDCSVDLIISNCVLNLVPNKIKAFQEIFRVLKPGGRIAIADIVLDGQLPDALQDNVQAYCACISGAVSRQAYLRGLEVAGLTDVRVESEFDAAALLTGGCCNSATALQGVATSIRVTARKPAGGCCCH